MNEDDRLDLSALIMATDMAGASMKRFGEAVGEVARKMGKNPPTVAAVQRQNRQRVHEYVPAGSYCGVCGLALARPIHQVPPAAEKPTLTMFDVGDRVQVHWHDTWWNGSVVQEQRNDRGEQIVVDVRMDEGPHQEWFPVAAVRPAMKVPQFGSIEEADAWMDEQRKLGY